MKHINEDYFDNNNIDVTDSGLSGQKQWEYNIILYYGNPPGLTVEECRKLGLLIKQPKASFTEHDFEVLKQRLDMCDFISDVVVECVEDENGNVLSYCACAIMFNTEYEFTDSRKHIGKILQFSRIMASVCRDDEVYVMNGDTINIADFSDVCRYWKALSEYRKNNSKSHAPMEYGLAFRASDAMYMFCFKIFGLDFDVNYMNTIMPYFIDRFISLNLCRALQQVAEQCSFVKWKSVNPKSICMCDCDVDYNEFRTVLEKENYWPDGTDVYFVSTDNYYNHPNLELYNIREIRDDVLPVYYKARLLKSAFVKCNPMHIYGNYSSGIYVKKFDYVCISVLFCYDVVKETSNINRVFFMVISGHKKDVETVLRRFFVIPEGRDVFVSC